MQTIPCDVVLLPEPALAQKAITASQKFADYDPLFTLKIGMFYPHMSLYMFQLSVSAIDQAEQLLGDIASGTQVVKATAKNYTLGSGHAVGYIDPGYVVTEELRALQQRVINDFNPIRSGMRESDIVKMRDATGPKLRNLQQWGYPSVGELFRPHMTLTRLKEYNSAALNVLPEITTFSGHFNRIGLFEMGPNGTCVRLIKECKLI